MKKRKDPPKKYTDFEKQFVRDLLNAPNTKTPCGETTIKETEKIKK